MEPIRILHVFGGLDAGGAESRTMDIYRQIDRMKVQFDFLIHTSKKGYFEDEISDMGGKIYVMPRFSPKTIFNYIKKVDNFFKLHSEYKIVHGHILSTAFIYQRIAKKYKVPVRIAHSRCGSRTHINFENIIKEIFKRLARYYVTDKFAVSKVAGKSAFGKKSLFKGSVKVIPNAIKADNYIYDENIRNITRKELKLDDKFIIGHIGRLQKQKNHKFLLEIFYEVQKLKSNAILLLIGDGELKNNIKEKVNKLHLDNKVIFAGVRSDVPKLLQAIDILLFPSFYEGLPGVVLEAQAAGLPCIISDKITKEVRITDLVEFIALKKDAKYWAERVINSEKSIRKNTYNNIVEANYDITTIAKWYEEFYLGKYKEYL